MNQDKELLLYIIVLYDICLKADLLELKKYTLIMSRLVETEIFNKVLRKTMKLLDGEICGREICGDWLINALFQLYKDEPV